MLKDGDVNVAEMPDWDLIVATNWYGCDNHLPKDIQGRLMVATWAHQDGYGVPGYIPAQGWDWSGIRDSSPEAVVAMAAALRRVLDVLGIGVLNLKMK